ncbi:MAG: hypothetical protein WAZ12_05530 [Candidatus Absconditicoccaceae bacterium]
MKKSNLLNLFIFSGLLVVFFAFTIPYNWDGVVEKAQKDFSKVITNQIVSKTIDSFLSNGYYQPQLKELNWFARENFLQAHSPWNMEEYRVAAYATFTAWDGKSSITPESYAYYYFKSGGIDTAIARPFQNFRNSIIEIAKEYLSDPDNLNSIYQLYKPMLVIKFKDRRDVLLTARTSIELYLSGRGSELSKYDREFLQRREAEGGKSIIQEYYALLDDLIFAI